MLQKFKDGANKLKAKIGGDELDEKLVEVVSQENWQASTQQLHEIANAAYNYEKWHRINEFIWEKLKKSKSWKKILKTFNLIQFLLKNGPPSIISNFKYDLYQLRVFESYSNYVDGLDKGEPIRERAKIVVGLLSNEEQLEQQRLKAKTIRQKMSNVVGGSGYSNAGGSGNYGGSYGGSTGYGGGSYGSYGSKQQKKKSGGQAYNYGTGVGHFGDYTYNKSTIDKYKDNKGEKPSGGSTSDIGKKEEKKPEIVVESKKPFEKPASKLSKPGQKKQSAVETPSPTPTAPTTVTTTSNSIDIDLFGTGPSPAPANPTPAPTQLPFSFEQTPPTQQPLSPQVYQQPAPTQPAPPQYQQPAPQYHQPAPQYQQPAPQYQQPAPQYQQPTPPQYHQPAPPQYPGQQFQQQAPQFNLYGQPAPQPGYGQQFGQYGHPPQAPGQFAGYGQPQPQYGAHHPQGYQQPSQYVNPMYSQTAPMAAGQMPLQQKPVNMGITLQTKKKDDEFGNFASSNLGTAQNVNWLSNTEKGLIDFSDFGSELSKNPKQTKPNEVSNNIQIDTWSW